MQFKLRYAFERSREKEQKDITLYVGMCKNYKSNDTLLPGEIVISLKKSAKKKYLDPTVHLIYDSVSVHIDTVYGTQSM